MIDPMRVRFPIPARLLVGFFANLALLALGFWLLFRAQFGAASHQIFEGIAEPRVQALAERVSAELRTRPERDWDRVLAINLTGVFHGCKRALREMLPRGRGRIVNMASVAGLNGTGGGAAYVASKHGVVGLTRQMAVTYSARGLTINAVAPGPILTGLRAHSQEILGPGVPDMSGRGVAVDDAAVRAIAPVGRRGTVEEIASAVCFLASDGAGYITGHTLVVDGGWRAK